MLRCCRSTTNYHGGFSRQRGVQRQLAAILIGYRLHLGTYAISYCYVTRIANLTLKGMPSLARQTYMYIEL